MSIMSSKTSPFTSKRQLHSSPTSPFFAFVTPSQHQPVVYYTPLGKHDEDFSGSIYEASQLKCASDLNENIYQCVQGTRTTVFSSHHVDPTVHRSRSRLRWLAGLAGVMILAMLLCGNKLGDTDKFVLPFDSAKNTLGNLNSSSLGTLNLKSPPIESGALTNLTSFATLPSANHGVKFLFPVRIAEQETKASSHLLQLGLLARFLNRTLVLPHVGGGYISQCAPLAFEAYYSSDALAKWGISAISQADLENSLSNTVKARHVEFLRPGATSFLTLSTVSRFREDIEGCLSPGLSAHLNISAEGLVLKAPAGWRKSLESRSAFGKSLVSHLGKYAHTEALLVDWKMIHPIYTPVPSFVKLKYNPTLEILAERLVKLLGGPKNILGVHWRQETVPVAVIEHCAELLEKHLGDGSEEWLWLASDYPFENFLGPQKQDELVGHPHSGTFRTLTATHHTTMAKLITNLQRISENTHKHKLVSLRTLISAHAFDDPIVGRFVEEFGEERGALGIVEKLVLRSLGRILMGSDGVGQDLRCSKGSSYSRQVVKMHQELENGLETGGRRVVSFWP